MTTEHETDEWTAGQERVQRALIETGNPFLILFYRDAFAALAERCKRPFGKKPEERIERLTRLGVGKSARAAARTLCDEVLPAAMERAQSKMKEQQEASADITDHQENPDVEDDRSPGVRRQAGRRRRSGGASGSV